MPSIKIEGLRELSAHLKKVSADLPKELKKVSKDAAEIVAAEARTIVPVRSGRLRNKIQAGATLKGADVRAMGLPYAAVIHFGWKRHNIRPNPFLYKALDSRREEVIAKFEEGLHDLIEHNF